MEAIKLNEERFMALMEKLIGESKFVQNKPPELIPQEVRVANHVLEVLKPYNVENGGVLHIETVEYKPGRTNVIIKYKPEGAKGSVAFVGSHMDVVPANPDTWERDPFKLVVEGDYLYGRGTTDCLGHVALLTDLFAQLGETKPALNVNVTAVFIASEENNEIPNIGVDELERNGKLEDIKGGPLYWVDSADSQPCIGTAAVANWKLKVNGKLCHSGLPHRGINSIELASEVLAKIQQKFYEAFPPHAEESTYEFSTPSTFKPTQTKCAEGSLNQIPPWTEIEGDIRLTPFYNLQECMKKVDEIVAELNTDITQLPQRGPVSMWKITQENGEDVIGSIEWTWADDPYKGIACKLDSPGFEALRDAHKDVKGSVKPYSICGSLPLVGDLQASGFDVQVVGYGISSVYHGDNEYCLLSDMKDATLIFSKVIQSLSTKLA